MDALTDNVFCTAILQILNMPDILSDSPIVGLDEVKCDFEKNGYGDETFHEPGLHFGDGIIKRKPLSCLQSEINKPLSKKAQKMAKAQKSGFCRFCENNNEAAQVYNSHSLRDNTGKLTCPRLRNYVCPICSASGDNAHTVRYCNLKPIYIHKGGEKNEVKKVRFSMFFKNTIRV